MLQLVFLLCSTSSPTFLLRLSLELTQQDECLKVVLETQRRRESKKAPWSTVSDTNERLRTRHITVSTVVPGRRSRQGKVFGPSRCSYWDLYYVLGTVRDTQVLRHHSKEVIQQDRHTCTLIPIMHRCNVFMLLSMSYRGFGSSGMQDSIEGWGELE